MSLRAVGEGHLSSVEFRTGTIDADGVVTLDGRCRHDGAARPVVDHATPRRLRAAARASSAGTRAAPTSCSTRCPRPSTGRSRPALAGLRDQRLTRGSAVAAIDRFEWIAACNYSIEFPSGSALDERVIMPARPVGEPRDRGRRGSCASPMTTARSTTAAPTPRSTASGRAAAAAHRATSATFTSPSSAGLRPRNKGMALFPRRVGGRSLALSRWDRESNALASSGLRDWAGAGALQAPAPARGRSSSSATAAPRSRPRPAGWSSPTASGRCGSTRSGRCCSTSTTRRVVIGALARPLLSADPRRARRLRPERRLLLRRPAPRRHAGLAVRLQRRVDPGGPRRRAHAARRAGIAAPPGAFGPTRSASAPAP